MKQHASHENILFYIQIFNRVDFSLHRNFWSRRIVLDKMLCLAVVVIIVDLIATSVIYYVVGYSILSFAHKKGKIDKFYKVNIFINYG